MWSKTSESSVENSFAYVMEQDSNLQFFTSNFAQKINLDTKIGLNLDNEIDFRSVKNRKWEKKNSISRKKKISGNKIFFHPERN